MPAVPPTTIQATKGDDSDSIEELVSEVERRAPADSYSLLRTSSDEDIAKVLRQVNPGLGLKILRNFSESRKDAILLNLPQALATRWKQNESFNEKTVGRLMDTPDGVFQTGMTVAQAVEQLRGEVETAFLTYGYVVNADNQLLGVVVMRDLLLAEPTTLVDDVMVGDPYCLHPDDSVLEAMKEVIHRHYPVYPVCDEENHLLGLVRGYTLFAEEVMQITAQPGRMVGVVEEERVSTSWGQSLRFRHPWLQLNLVTAFVAAFVVGMFEGTIEQIVALAVFLPVLAGQSGNTGCQALAVTLRGMTLGELSNRSTKSLVTKEASLGLLNGSLVGIVAGGAMFAYASILYAGEPGGPSPLMLALVVFLAMIGSCVVSGMSGALVPIGLKRLGADPATASSIFLTTATDVASMGFFLSLATVLVL